MKWDVWNSIEYDAGTVSACATASGCSLLMAAVLWARGLSSPEEIAGFLSTDRAKLHDPMLMADMDKAAARVKQAIASGEQVAVFGDYDVDGVTSSALLADYLKSYGLSCSVYIPDRLGEGYGLNLSALETLASEGVSLVITVDCGVTSVDEVAYAKTLGIDMVITDHHQCTGVLPDAVAVIDPKRPDCTYPDAELSGVGVAFKLVCAVEDVDQLDSLLERYADLVAIGTVADVMDLSGENRVLVTEGLTQIRRNARAGLQALMQDAGIDQKMLNVTNIGYGLAPRLNAAGRMGNADLAFSLLEAETAEEAEALADELSELNQKRQGVEQTILEEALAMLDAEGYTSGPIVLAHEAWHKGVLGVVASRLLERYREPVILLCVENGLGRGSCRSVDGFDLFSGLEAASHLLDTFGGHEQAAGLTVSMEQFVAFKEAFFAYYAAHPPQTETAVLRTDFIVTDPALLSLDQVKSLDRLEPCGRGNPNPLLVIEGATLVRVQSIGGGKHLKLQVEKWGQSFDCIYFGMTAETLGACEGDLVDLVFTPQCNHFRGKTTVQLLMRDLGLSERRLMRRARALCRSLLAGETVSATLREARLLHPERAHFVSLWRGLKDIGETVSGHVDHVLARFTSTLPTLSPARTYVCLRVFGELGLIEVSEDANTLHIRCTVGEQKVDLDTSQILRSLQGVMDLGTI